MIIGVLLLSDQIVSGVPYASTLMNTTATMTLMFLQNVQLTDYFNLHKLSYRSELAVRNEFVTSDVVNRGMLRFN